MFQPGSLGHLHLLLSSGGGQVTTQEPEGRQWWQCHQTCPAVPEDVGTEAVILNITKFEVDP